MTADPQDELTYWRDQARHWQAKAEQLDAEVLDEVERLRKLLGEAVAQHDECCVNERICDCHGRIAAIRKEAGIE